MKREVFIKHIDNLELVPTNHKVGIKKLLFEGNQKNSNITQVAYGYLSLGDVVELHKHESMDECFFVEFGSCYVQIDNEEFFLTKGSFLLIPAGYLHAFYTKEEVGFIYWGVKV